MEWYGWLGGGLCCGLVSLAAIVVAYWVIIDSRKKNRTLHEGEPITAWLVQANVSLFEAGMLDLPALALISPDEKTANDREYMTELAERISELKDVDPDDCEDKDEAFIAELMSDETYIEGKRDKLPKRFTRGRNVYLAHVFVFRDHLPGQRITRSRLYCSIIWDDPKSMICTRPAPKRKHPDDEEE